MSLSRLSQFVAALQSTRAVDGLEILIALKQIGLRDSQIYCVCPELLGRFKKLKALDDFIENRSETQYTAAKNDSERESESDWLKRVAKEVQKPDLMPPSEVGEYLEELRQEEINPDRGDTDEDKLHNLDPLGVYANMTFENAWRLHPQQMKIWQEVQQLAQNIKMSPADRAALDSSRITDAFKHLGKTQEEI